MAAEEAKAKDEAKTKEAPAQPEIQPLMFLAPALMLAIRYFKVDVNQYVVELRIAFGCAVVLNFLSMFFIFMKAQANAEGATQVTVKDKKPGQRTAEEKTMTFREYDLQHLQNKVFGAGMSLLISCGIHYKWGNATPLLLQAIMIPVNAVQDPLFKLHILGAKPEGKLKRPFPKAPNALEELMTGGEEEATKEGAVEKKRSRSKKAKGD
uniref:Inorganic phosphate transporter n=1 Tax=Rhizochromulina marina TaxID=1034831 RepID=A0A7S2SW02_9STRA|mmetsp:Transcript_8883/g.25354  ORF Transcript_8883/g.25354 Transcript_8883/m.25354 type:complete len:209 (+) Transcript_8883:144-770(+)|eukprot:CAMPEP_0118963328 /NCGR_PEP_ID=MMETSP1173-20130426/1277_1 /TAXON_ID=1034831 /ORGANISM="Rhizochromulina marina cf, Strain CCMP1243" /LENGTH=208 /DNA_ID=CAMNT_0006911651 /DNA_START=159 /DNA_END=785 /DNA_ORIENTATION=-